MYCMAFIRKNNSISTLEKGYFPWEIVFLFFSAFKS